MINKNNQKKLSNQRSGNSTLSIIVILSILIFITATAIGGEKQVNKLIVQADLGTEKISRYIYGHFAEHLGRCIYEGIWVGEDSPIPNTRGIRNDVVAALKKINIPVLRWPGGCFADTYHWMDGIGSKDQRPTIINVHWGGVTENNHFGTHEFLDLCEQLGCEAYICGNVGSGTVQEFAQWVEYVTFDGKSPMADLRHDNGRDRPWQVKFWGIGNESWGCGGNMRAEYYADVMRRYATFCRNFGDNKVYRIACGSYGEDYHWTEVLMKDRRTREMMQGLSFHYYTVFENWGNKGSATNFDEYRWFGTLKTTLRMEELIQKHTIIMDRHDPEKKIGFIIDEWGDWFDVEPGTNPGFLYQQNTLRDGLVAAINLNIFNHYCDRVKMANIAQTINVLQAMILTKDEQMIVTPSYHVFDMYKVHQDAVLLPTDMQCVDYTYKDQSIPAVNVSASRDSSGRIHISLCNLDPNHVQELICEIRGISFSQVAGNILTAEKMTAHNTFEKPDVVKPVVFRNFRKTGNQLMINLPSKSIVVLELQ